MDIPNDYIGKQVEVLVYPLDGLEQKIKAVNIADFTGALKLSDSQYKDFEQHLQNVRNKWE